MTGTTRPFNPKALRPYGVAAIWPQLGPETLVRRYTVLVPVQQVQTGAAPRMLATLDDLQNLQYMLIKHFGGVTVSASLIGWGARDPRRPKQTLEHNKHTPVSVYAAAVRASDEYFLALQKELSEALDEGVIQIERQDVTIL